MVKYHLCADCDVLRQSHFCGSTYKQETLCIKIDKCFAVILKFPHA